MCQNMPFHNLWVIFADVPAYHIAFEALLLVSVIILLLRNNSFKHELQLSEKEIEQLISEWKPEPLVPDTPQDHYALNPRCVTSKIGKYIVIDGKNCLNLATHNYLGLSENISLEEAALKALKKYGVGSCGPRGFYGTVDIHLDIENRIAKFMQVEDSILYSYAFSTIASAIPSYAKSGDIIFCDAGVHFAIQKGLTASRSEIKFFKHNDIQDLERLILDQEIKETKQAKIVRKFLIVEALYMNYGDICPLKQIIELKKKFKIRLFVDESISFGILGDHGRGITEYLGIDINEIDHISGSLENTISAYGGFCCGSRFMIDNQRLSGLGYCFSASLPPLQAAVSIEALKIIEERPELLLDLRKNCEYANEILNKIEYISIQGHPISPVKHLRFAKQSSDKEIEQKKLEKLCDYAMNKGYALTVARYVENEEFSPPSPSIRLIVNSLLTKSEIEDIGEMLKEAFEKFS